MDFFFVIAVEILYAIASLVLISAGLAIVFGMMKVINLAHGEFMMMGGYAAITAVNLGVNVFRTFPCLIPCPRRLAHSLFFRNKRSSGVLFGAI